MITIDMEKVEENKEEIKEKLISLEQNISELENSENESDRKVAQLLRNELELFKVLVSDKES